jgi:hypothetical protein
MGVQQQQQQQQQQGRNSELGWCMWLVKSFVAGND